MKPIRGKIKIMNKDKLQEAINMMGEALNEETQAASPQKVAGPPRQPGQAYVGQWSILYGRWIYI